MNNASNRPFALSKPPTEDFLRVVRELNAIATRLGIPFFLVGAAARDIVLVNLWGQSPGRATADIDFAFAVNDWAEFKQLREELLATRHFEPVPRKEQRLLYTDSEHRFQLPVDFIPFRGVASETQTISFPPDGDFVMNVAGFEEALQGALSIELEPGLVISVASLPGLAILKRLRGPTAIRRTTRTLPTSTRLLPLLIARGIRTASSIGSSNFSKASTTI